MPFQEAKFFGDLIRVLDPGVSMQALSGADALLQSGPASPPPTTHLTNLVQLTQAAAYLLCSFPVASQQQLLDGGPSPVTTSIMHARKILFVHSVTCELAVLIGRLLSAASLHPGMSPPIVVLCCDTSVSADELMATQ